MLIMLTYCLSAIPLNVYLRLHADIIFFLCVSLVSLLVGTRNQKLSVLSLFTVFIRLHQAIRNTSFHFEFAVKAVFEIIYLVLSLIYTIYR